MHAQFRLCSQRPPDQDGTAHLRELFLFWNLVDRRERTALYEQYEKVLDQLGLRHLRTHIPVRSNFNKDIQETGGPVYRCTLLPPDRLSSPSAVSTA